MRTKSKILATSRRSRHRRCRLNRFDISFMLITISMSHLILLTMMMMAMMMVPFRSIHTLYLYQCVRACVCVSLCICLCIKYVISYLFHIHLQRTCFLSLFLSKYLLFSDDKKARDVIRDESFNWKREKSLKAEYK